MTEGVVGEGEVLNEPERGRFVWLRDEGKRGGLDRSQSGDHFCKRVRTEIAMEATLMGDEVEESLMMLRNGGGVDRGEGGKDGGNADGEADADRTRDEGIARRKATGHELPLPGISVKWSARTCPRGREGSFERCGRRNRSRCTGGGEDNCCRCSLWGC